MDMTKIHTERIRKNNIYISLYEIQMRKLF